MSFRLCEIDGARARDSPLVSLPCYLVQAATWRRAEGLWAT